VYLTRETDKDLAAEDTEGLSNRKSEDIRNRLEFIHDRKADVFVTIHLNALTSTRWHGAQTFYYPEMDESSRLAKMIQSDVIPNLENTARTARAPNRRYLLKHAEVPGSLVESGFLSHEEERELVKQEHHRPKTAGSIHQRILGYAPEEVADEEHE